MGAFSLSIDGARCDVMRKKGKLMARLFVLSVSSTTADPVMVLGGPVRATTTWPASPEGPGGFEKRSASLGAPARPARLLAVWTLKSIDDIDGVVAFQDQRPQTIRVPVGQTPVKL